MKSDLEAISERMSELQRNAGIGIQEALSIQADVAEVFRESAKAMNDLLFFDFSEPENQEHEETF